mgnify:CR=1 FL=1
MENEIKELKEENVTEFLRLLDSRVDMENEIEKLKKEL